MTELNDLNFQVSNPVVIPFDSLDLKRDLASSKICNYGNLKESFLRQKSRSLWLKDGDWNSSFLHKVMKERYIRNFISFVNSDDGRKEKVDAIKSEVCNFFEFNFLEENRSRPKLNGVDLLKFSFKDRMSLEAVFMEEEIKAVVWSCNGNKSPGPDDFSLSFLHSYWETVKKNVFRFVQDFYSNSTLTKATTTSFLTLTPKIKNPQLLVNYRPIYLVSCLQKIISKILASRLKMFIGNVISLDESSFVPRRRILDGVVVVNEILELGKTTRRDRMVIKIDFERAYDCVN